MQYHQVRALNEGDEWDQLALAIEKWVEFHNLPQTEQERNDSQRIENLEGKVYRLTTLLRKSQLANKNNLKESEELLEAQEMMQTQLSNLKIKYFFLL